MAHRNSDRTDEATRALIAASFATDDGPYGTRLQAVRRYGLSYSTVQIIEITGYVHSSLMGTCARLQTIMPVTVARKAIELLHAGLHPTQQQSTS